MSSSHHLCPRGDKVSLINRFSQIMADTWARLFLWSSGVPHACTFSYPPPVIIHVVVNMKNFE